MNPEADWFTAMSDRLEAWANELDAQEKQAALTDPTAQLTLWERELDTIHDRFTAWERRLDALDAAISQTHEETAGEEKRLRGWFDEAGRVRTTLARLDASAKMATG